ncbi:MAG: thioredoxin domain-containing protein [Myxococcota bacterium]
MIASMTGCSRNGLRHRSFHRALWTLGALAFAGLVVACQTPTSEAPDEDAAIAARIGDEVITLEELDDFVKDDLFRRETRGGNESRLYEIRSRALQQLSAQRVLDGAAAAQGLTADALVDAEAAKLGEVTMQEVATFYTENRAQMGGATLDQVEPQIRNHLQNERRRDAVRALIDAAGIETELERPRVSVTGSGPSIGPDDAPVTIVEFSDFQCPYCRRAGPVMKDLVERFPNQVRVVYRHLPLDSHDRARASAEASECVAEQGRFWEYHDTVFENPRALADADLRRYAEELEVDLERFDACYAERRHAQKVQADAVEAARVGITGTPGFVVNGIVLFGLQPTEVFEEIIREELAAAAPAAAAE